jgi:hypothetical protein
LERVVRNGFNDTNVSCYQTVDGDAGHIERAWSSMMAIGYSSATIGSV